MAIDLCSDRPGKRIAGLQAEVATIAVGCSFLIIGSYEVPTRDIEELPMDITSVPGSAVVGVHCNSLAEEPHDHPGAGGNRNRRWHRGRDKVLCVEPEFGLEGNHYVLGSFTSALFVAGRKPSLGK
jgi:hypothetical protein